MEISRILLSLASGRPEILHELEEQLILAASIYETVFGADHPFVARPLLILCDVLMELGEFDKARAQLRRALVIGQHAQSSLLDQGGETSGLVGQQPFEEVAERWARLGDMLVAAGRPSEAASDYRAALQPLIPFRCATSAGSYAAEALH